MLEGRRSHAIDRPFDFLEEIKMKRRPLPPRVQSVLISRDHPRARTATGARAVAKSFGAKTTKVDKTEGYWRFRQHNPSSYKNRTFRTATITPNVKFVYGTPKEGMLENPNSACCGEVLEALESWPRPSWIVAIG